MLDLMRFASAVVVFLYHFHFQLPGYQAVMIFFVLSGYFISTSVIKTLDKGVWSWREYLIKRCIRLWIVLIPALILTYGWALLQTHLFGRTSLFSGVLNVKTFIGNLFFTQDILVVQYGLNGPLWSLTYEFWYYILFPCGLLIFYSKSKLSRGVYLTIFVAISLFVGKQIMLYFIMWLLGAGIAVIKPSKIKSWFINHFILLILLATAVGSTKGLYSFYDKQFNWMNPYFIPDLSVSIAFSLLIYWIISIYGSVIANKKLIFNKKLAGFSYTLYLVHYPLLYFWNAWTTSSLWKFNNNYTLLVKVIYLLAIVIYAYVLAHLTEFKTSDFTTKVLTFSKKLFVQKAYRKRTVLLKRGLFK
ncbi:acyltransferase family protein [Priestia aryabhattai]